MAARRRPDPPGGPGRGLIVAIDGPSGAGKSTVARAVAARLGLRYLDTGSTYRALTWDLLRRGIDVEDAVAVAAHAAVPELGVGTDPAAPGITVDRTDVADAIRTAEVTTAVSPVSAVPAVRRRLAALQREIIRGGGIVVEGRDIGTVVAPDADVKIFLTAAATARAERRGAELAADPAGTLLDLTRRDRYDSGRATAPLAKAPDAYSLDATERTADEVVDTVLALVRRHLATGSAAGLAGHDGDGNPSPIDLSQPLGAPLADRPRRPR